MSIIAWHGLHPHPPTSTHLFRRLGKPPAQPYKSTFHPTMHAPRPEQRRRRPLILNLNLSREPELLAALRARSARTGAPVSELVRRAIRAALATAPAADSTDSTPSSNPSRKDTP